MQLNHDVQIAMSDDFLKSFTQLPQNIQNKSLEFLNRFRSNPTSPGLNFEKIKTAKSPLFSARIDKKYRVIIWIPEKAVCALMWVDSHDEAYDWAEGRRIEIHPETGAIQVLSVKNVDAARDFAQKSRVEKPLFDLRDRDIRRLGVPDDLIGAVLALSSKEELKTLKDALPADSFEALTWIAEGFSYDEVFKEFSTGLLDSKEASEDEQAPQISVAEALQTPASRRHFSVLTDDMKLQAMLNSSIAAWRVFLHPTQRRLVERTFRGPARVLGGAGTGKTVVAMHRAMHLARKYPEERILFTTYTVNLAMDIQEQLRLLATDYATTDCSSESLLSRIEVINFDRFVESALRILTRSGAVLSHLKVLRDGEKLRELAEMARSPLDIDETEYPTAFLLEEFEFVVQALGIQNEKEYWKCRRLGRGTQLSRQQRQHVWPFFEELKNEIAAHNFLEASDAMREIIQAIQNPTPSSRSFQPSHRFIIVDECQDFSPAAFELLHTLSVFNHDSTDCLFMVGDTFQRIYARPPVVLSKAGIEIRGRSARLKINYRTTEEIRDFAQAVITGLSSDDLNGGDDTLKGYRSLTYGEHPILKGFEAREEERSWIQSQLTQMIETGSICVALHTNRQADEWADFLKDSFEVLRLNASTRDDARNVGPIRIATMHRIKGLEFDHVLLPELSQNGLKSSFADQIHDPVLAQKAQDTLRCLLYVAFSRARKSLTLTYSHKPSERLAPLIRKETP